MIRTMQVERLSDTNPKASMFSIGIIALYKHEEVCRLTTAEGFVVPQVFPTATALDPWRDLSEASKQVCELVEEKRLCVPGEEFRVNLSNLRGHDMETLVADSARRAMVITERSELNVPLITNDPELLAYYGFYIFSSEAYFTVRSPIGFLPILPLFVGSDYGNDRPGRLFLESHGPNGSVHLWAPIEHSCSGYIIAAKKLPSSKDGCYRFKLAKFSIPFGSTLICSAEAWHCDSFLGGGTYLCSYSLSIGLSGNYEHELVTLQPLVNTKSNILNLAP